MNNNIPAFRAVGEMAELTRSFDWKGNILGEPEKWPQSLISTLSIILNSKFPMFLWWGDDLIQFYNDAYRPSLGNEGKHPAALGQRGEECWPEIWPTIKPLIDQVKSGGPATWGEDQLIPIYRNGRLEDVYWTFSYTPVYEESGNVGGVLVVCQETTPMIEALQKLRTSDQHFNNLVREASVGIIILIGEEMRVEVVNDAYGRLIDRTREDLQGKLLFSVIPEAEDPFRDMLDKVMLTGESLHLYEHPYYIMVNGKRKEGFLDFVYQPYTEADGTITGVMAIVHDVTVRVMAAREMEKSKKELDSLANAMPQVVWVAGADGKVVFYNERVMGFAGAERLPDGTWRWEAMLHDEDLEATLEAWSKAVREGSVYEIEHRVKMTDGDFRWHLSRAFPQKNENGIVIKWYGTATDVHASKENEKALFLNNVNLTRANMDLDNFIYTASHDLKAPISNIEGLLALLSVDFSVSTEKQQEVRDIMGMMQESVDRFKKTINSLTDVVRLQQENAADAVIVDVNEVIKGIILDLGFLIKTSGAQVKIDVDSCSAIHFSEKNLRSVIYNLLSNGIKYCSPERVPEVQIHCQSNNAYHILTVQDNGLGIEPDKIGDLFTMFKRFHDHVEGTGIGLYMVKKIIDNAGGRIEVESRLNKGTTFRVYFPR